MSLGPCIDLFDSKKFTHFLYILKGIHKYFGGANPLYRVHDMFDCGPGGENGKKNWKFENLKYGLMPVGASRYNILKTIYKIST